MLRSVLTASAGDLGLVGSAVGSAAAFPVDGVLPLSTPEVAGAVDGYELAHPSVVVEAFAGTTAPAKGTAAYDEQDIFRLDLSRFQVVHGLFSDDYSKERFFMYTRRTFDTAAKEAVTGVNSRFFLGEVGNVYANMANLFSGIADFFDEGDLEYVNEVVVKPGVYEQANWVRMALDTVDGNAWLKEALDKAVINGSGAARFGNEDRVKRGLTIFFSALETMSQAITAQRSLYFPDESV